MVTCSLCNKEFKNGAGLAGHKALAHHAQEVSEDRLEALERRFGELIEVVGARLEQGEEVVTEKGDAPVTVKDLRIRDLEAELSYAKGMVDDLGEKLRQTERRHAFGSFAEVLAHAKSKTCSDCSQSFEDLALLHARTTLTEIDDKALLELAVQRGVLPETIRIQLPD